MYNSLAQAINAVSSGIPLDWRCIRWSYDGHIVAFDPAFGFGPGSGWFGCIATDGHTVLDDGGNIFTQAPVSMDAVFTFTTLRSNNKTLRRGLCKLCQAN